MKEHSFQAGVRWSSAAGTANYRAYSRDHEVVAAAKPDIPASSAPAYRGDATRYNPEELLVAALASCHMLWYLHLCSERGIVVTEYADDAFGRMRLDEDGSGAFAGVTLRPRVTVGSGDLSEALALHEEAHRLCFIARSVNFAISIESQGAFRSGE